MSSRRDSRTHISERQNDTLLEFENFKRKYLLVNKHITKLNSTLSVRVEELNAQVSSLYVDNLRLRASEISLVSQLKREKEKTQQVVDQAENAVGSLLRRLTDMRTSLDIQSAKRYLYSPNLKRKLTSSLVQPPREAMRLVKPPADAITQIHEEDEDADAEDDDTPTLLATTRRQSTSRLPLPKLVPPPSFPLPPPRSTAIPHINLAAGAGKRKVRTDNAMLVADQDPETERSSSPTVRLMSARRARRSPDEREDEACAGVGLDIIPIGGLEPKLAVDHGIMRTERMAASEVKEKLKKVNRKGKNKELSRDWEREIETRNTSERESTEGTREKDKRRFGIKDVTNSPRKAISEFSGEKPNEAAPSSALTVTPLSGTPMFESSVTRSNTSPLPTVVSMPATDAGSESGEGTGGRERRTRKSVNYAEPKLNTKMRKPDPPETMIKSRTSGSATTRRRKSVPTRSPGFPSDDDGDADVEGFNVMWTEGRRKTMYNTVPGSLSLRPTDPETPIDTYGVWGPEERRHSMAV